jgi:hypothetical protein
MFDKLLLPEPEHWTGFHDQAGPVRAGLFSDRFTYLCLSIGKPFDIATPADMFYLCFFWFIGTY